MNNLCEQVIPEYGQFCVLVYNIYGLGGITGSRNTEKNSAMNPRTHTCTGSKSDSKSNITQYKKWL